MLPVDIELPSGVLFYTRENKLCGTLADEIRCAVCSCDIEAYTLDLNTSFAKRVFASHEHRC